MITINKNISPPIYIQIYAQIKANILNGTYGSNMKLSPTRLLAQELKVSRITVVNAYELLKNEDLIVSNEGSYYFVNPKLKPIYKKKLQKELDEFNPKKYDLDFSDFNAAINEATINSWYKFVRKETAFIDYYDIKNMYSFRGINELLVEIKKMCNEYRDYNPDLKQIILGTGIETSCEIIGSILNGKIKKIAIGNLNNIRLANYFKRFNLEILGYGELDEKGLEELSKKDVDVILVSPSQYRDFGRVLTLEERERILNWAYEKENRYIIENDYCSEYVYCDNPPSIISLDKKNRVFYYNSFSKILGSDIRTNYTIVPNNMIKELEENYWFRACENPFLIQWLIYRYLATDKFDESIRQNKKKLLEAQQVMIESLKKHFKNKITISGTDSGQSISVSFNVNKSNEEILEFCRRNEINFGYLDNLHIEKYKLKNALLLNFSSMEASKIDKKIERLSNILLPFLEKY